MEYLLGKEISEVIKKNILDSLSNFSRPPHLVVLLNEKDSSSLVYVHAQEKNARALGYKFTIVTMPESEEKYIEQIEKLNNDDSVDGIMVTRPLFKGADEWKILSHISLNKDVDAMNYQTLGEILIDKKDALIPATAKAIIMMLDYYNIDVKGKNALIIGRSISVGKPVSLLLLNRHATITVAHTKTNNLDHLLAEADIIIVATGKPHLIDCNKMKENAIVIDAGINYVDGKIVGDCVPSEQIKYLSKVPGGVGTITSMVMMSNVLECYRRNHHGK